MNRSAFLLGIFFALFPVAFVWANGVTDRYYGRVRWLKMKGDAAFARRWRAERRAAYRSHEGDAA